uniref:Uncharacterized protein n=1 Tax=Anguilla anguilla TaxID=7936 RepID=A0A0E9PG73_ANGAN
MTPNTQPSDNRRRTRESMRQGSRVSTAAVYIRFQMHFCHN